MGKEGELWDDSALIKAFDSAFSKYKVMHGISGSPDVGIASTSVVPENGSNEHIQVGDNNDPALATTERIGDNGNTSQVLENPTPELGLSVDHGSCPLNNATAAAQAGPSEKHTISSDLQSQNEYTWNPKDQKQYNLLWNKYYEIENQRQEIIQQLNQYINWNHQTYDTNTYPSQEHQGSVPQPYGTVTCSCPYGCQIWAAPCCSMPPCCSGGTCTDTSKGVPGGTTVSEEDPKIVKTAMAAAERALSSLMKEDICTGTSANGGKDKEIGVEGGHSITDGTNSNTDLAVVLNAWYSAGLHTGKYLTEQSFEKRKHP